MGTEVNNLSIYEQPEMLNSLMKHADMLANSTVIPLALRKKPADIFVILQLGHELSLPPITALNRIHVIDGKPTLSGELILALIRQKFPAAVIKFETSDDADIKKMWATCTMARCKEDMDNAFTSKWDFNKALKAQLLNKDNWKKMPQVMLRWRACSEAARIVFPDILLGLYTPDEAADINQTDPVILNEDGEVTENRFETVLEAATNTDYNLKDNQIKLIKELFAQLTKDCTASEKMDSLEYVLKVDNVEKLRKYTNEELARVIEKLREGVANAQKTSN